MRKRNVPEESTKPRCREDCVVRTGRVKLIGPTAQSTGAVRLCAVSIAYHIVSRLSICVGTGTYEHQDVNLTSAGLSAFSRLVSWEREGGTVLVLRTNL